MSECGVKEAFKEVRKGRSPEFVICDALLSERFRAAARRRGVTGNDACNLSCWHLSRSLGPEVGP